MTACYSFRTEEESGILLRNTVQITPEKGNDTTSSALSLLLEEKKVKWMELHIAEEIRHYILNEDTAGLNAVYFT